MSDNYYCCFHRSFFSYDWISFRDVFQEKTESCIVGQSCSWGSVCNLGCAPRVKCQVVIPLHTAMQKGVNSVEARDTGRNFRMRNCVCSQHSGKNVFGNESYRKCNGNLC